jgi:type I restriction enzyme S subunit
MFEKHSLGSLVERQQGGGTPERSNPRFWSGTIPWASVKDFADNQLILNSTEESITQQGLRASSTNLIPAGTPLVCTRMAVGRCAISSYDVAINQDVKALFPKSSVNPRYLLRLLDSLKFHAESVSVGSTVKGIRISDLLGIQTPIAPSHEQPKITQILNTLDTQIQKTEALIAKLEKIKEGLLHDLLTRGIDHNGQLRPAPEQAPELYKESALGLIPNDWEAKTVGELGTWRGGSTPSKSNPKFWPSQGLLWVSPKDLGQDIIDTTEDKVSGLAAGVANLTIFPPETVLVVFRSGILRRKLPVVKVLKNFTVNQDIKALLPADEISKGFIHYLLQGHAKGILNSSLKAGTTVESLDFRFFSSYSVPLPPLDEQEIISARLGSIESRLAKEAKLIEKLKTKKIGLMDDLLTGRVRVTSL